VFRVKHFHVLLVIGALVVTLRTCYGAL